jgi:hypothetical protein
MNLQPIYAILALLGLLAEVSLFALLIWRRHYQTFPFFTLYVGVNTVTDLVFGLFLFGSHGSLVPMMNFFMVLFTYVLELGVLLEIVWNVIHPVHVSLPRGVLKIFIAALVVIATGCAMLAWHFDSLHSRVDELKNPLDLTFGLLRMLIFAVTASFAQMLGIGWKNKVLQLATALSFYSAVDLSVSLAERISGRYNSLEPIHGLAYTLELGFLLYAFTTKDVERREFSPQMEQFLVTLAGRAKLARTVLVRMQVK